MTKADLIAVIEKQANLNLDWWAQKRQLRIEK